MRAGDRHRRARGEHRDAGTDLILFFSLSLSLRVGFVARAVARRRTERRTRSSAGGTDEGRRGPKVEHGGFVLMNRDSSKGGRVSHPLTTKRGDDDVFRDDHPAAAADFNVDATTR